MFNIIDTKTNKAIRIGSKTLRCSETEAHKRVDFLNACGIVRYKASRA